MVYDKYIIAFSGGKDSVACFLYLLDIGIPVHKIELWHHCIDGHQGETFMDWEITESYCQAFGAAFGVPVYFSWKNGGFKGEMLREDAYTGSTSFVTPDGEVVTVGGQAGKRSTRLKFPQVSPDLQVRWCSSYLKVDIGATALRNQPRFRGLKTVFISGERAEESSARSKYADLEPDRSDLRDGKTYQRTVDRWRPIKCWSEQQVWDIIEKYRVRVHPCYYMGWARCSCKFCIFGNSNQFASAYQVSPTIGDEIIGLEQQFGVTIKRNMPLADLIAMGTPYKAITPELKELATAREYNLKIIMPATETWMLPAGAFGESCGPS